MTTTRLQAPNGAYVSLGVGPRLIELQEPGAMRIVVGVSLPSAGAAAYHLISYPAGQFPYSGSETVYAQSDSSDFDPYIVVTPVV